MSVQSGHVPVSCDAPPYPIVEGCHLIGLTRPEDVRWRRVSELFALRGGWVLRLLARVWASVRGERGPLELHCSCGQPLLCVLKYMFIFDSGHRKCYRIGQCDRCRTIYWENA
jgi:hypothetical protein